MGRRMGSGVGWHWASCVVFCFTAVVVAGLGPGGAAHLVLSPGGKGMVLRFKTPLEIPINHWHKL